MPASNSETNYTPTEVRDAAKEFLLRILHPQGRQELSKVIDQLLKLRDDREVQGEAVTVAILHAFCEEYWRTYSLEKHGIEQDFRDKLRLWAEQNLPNHLKGREKEKALEEAVRDELDRQCEPHNRWLREKLANSLVQSAGPYPSSIQKIVTRQWAEDFLESVKHVEPNYADNARAVSDFHEARERALEPCWKAIGSSKSKVESISALITNKRLQKTSSGRINTPDKLFGILELQNPVPVLDLVYFVLWLFNYPAAKRRYITLLLAQSPEAAKECAKRVWKLNIWPRNIKGEYTMHVI